MMHPPLTLRVTPPIYPLEIGRDWVVYLDLLLGEQWPEPVVIDNVLLKDPDRLADLIPCVEAQGVTLRPGESYRIAQLLTPRRFGALPCSAWRIWFRSPSHPNQFEVQDQGDGFVRLGGRLEDCFEASFRVASRDDSSNV